MEAMTDQNKRFCELAGICWHEDIFDGQINRFRCKRCGKLLKDRENYIDYSSDPIAVLKVMYERRDWPKFCSLIGEIESYEPSAGLLGYELIEVNYLLKPNAMIKAAIEFMEAKNEPT
jgi:hypothetical protein